VPCPAAGTMAKTFGDILWRSSENDDYRRFGCSAANFAMDSEAPVR